jgi:hypothetical protein
VTFSRPGDSFLGIPVGIAAGSSQGARGSGADLYADKIKARAVQGVLHQTKQVDLGSGKEDVKAPLVTASVIYADEIEAERVVAGDIYVRDLDRN